MRRASELAGAVTVADLSADGAVAVFTLDRLVESAIRASESDEASVQFAADALVEWNRLPQQQRFDLFSVALGILAALVRKQDDA